MHAYLRDPDAIYRQSFDRVRAAIDLDAIDSSLHALVIRLVHACALPEIASDFSADPRVTGIASAALNSGKPIFVDAHMVASGITRTWVPDGVDVVCTLTEPGVVERAKTDETTRSAAAVDLWLDRLDGAVVAIGNAPTALFRLLEIIEAGGPKPACIFGMPIGFVGAAESKDDLIEVAGRFDIPFATVRGRFGGSALAAACINAVARPDHSGGAL